MSIDYRHVDVFASKAFTGNSLAVFPEGDGLTAEQMLAITQELRHFETIFLRETADASTVEARVFDLFEELDFAGHPILGAAAVLHERAEITGVGTWHFKLSRKEVTVTTHSSAVGYHAVLDQGKPEFRNVVPTADVKEIVESLNLPGQAMADLPLEVVSTGLRYLIVPVLGNLEEAKIVRTDFAELLGAYGAQYAYLVDVSALEGRHWNNDGILEDVATGSAAGCVGAYLAKHGVVPPEQEFTLKQGRFTGRPSRLTVTPQGRPDDLMNVRVGGQVAMVARGTFDVLPH